MRKLHVEQFKGIEFIRLSRLPFNQMSLLKDWLSATDIFSIKTQDGIEYTCVRYEDYEFWFDHFICKNQILTPSLF